MTTFHKFVRYWMDDSDVVHKTVVYLDLLDVVFFEMFFHEKLDKDMNFIRVITAASDERFILNFHIDKFAQLINQVQRSQFLIRYN